VISSDREVGVGETLTPYQTLNIKISALEQHESPAFVGCFGGQELQDSRQRGTSPPRFFNWETFEQDIPGVNGTIQKTLGLFCCNQGCVFDGRSRAVGQGNCLGRAGRMVAETNISGMPSLPIRAMYRLWVLRAGIFKTLLRLFLERSRHRLSRERIPTPDGDFLDLIGRQKPHVAWRNRARIGKEIQACLCLGMSGRFQETDGCRCLECRGDASGGKPGAPVTHSAHRRFAPWFLMSRTPATTRKWR